MTTLRSYDQQLCIRIFELGGRRKLDDRLMYAFSHLGYGYLYPVILFLFFRQSRNETRLLLPASLAAFALVAVGQTLLKRKANRPRPFETLPGVEKRMNPPDPFSFPSGHAAGAFLMATLCLHAHAALGLAALPFAMTVALSRVYMGMHYPSDVMAGSLLGVLSARLGLAIWL